MVKFKLNPTPYPELNIVLEKLVQGIENILGETLIGAYLQGSFAIGDFDEHSDVDFIIVIKDELTKDQVESLQAMHSHIYELDSYWAQHLEGSYYPLQTLNNLDQRGKTLWYLDNGANHLIKSDHCNTLVVRFVVREKGVILTGPSPSALVDPIPVELLKNEIHADINNWGQEILSNPERFKNHFYQTFIVLNFCRMLHDLHTGFPGSKRAGADWAKRNLHPSWKGLIDRTWAGRPVPELSVRRPADPKDFKSTLLFVKYIIEESAKIK